MKKSSILLLSLVAVLTACNKGTGNNDIFTQVRNRKVSKETKEGVMMRYDSFEIVFAMGLTTQNYTKENGEWIPGEPSTDTTYFKTIGSFHQEMPYIALYDILNYDTDDESESPEFIISTVGGKYQIITELHDWYDGKPKDIYNRVYNSLFSWGTSFFCGNTYFLASIANKSYMPQQALNKFAKKFNVVEDEESAPGTLEINDDGSEMVYSPSKYVRYEITCCNVKYDSYLLDGYDCDFSLTYEVEDNKVTMSYSTEIISVDYLNR